MPSSSRRERTGGNSVHCHALCCTVLTAVQYCTVPCCTLLHCTGLHKPSPGIEGNRCDLIRMGLARVDQPHPGEGHRKTAARRPQWHKSTRAHSTTEWCRSMRDNTWRSTGCAQRVPTPGSQALLLESQATHDKPHATGHKAQVIGSSSTIPKSQVPGHKSQSQVTRHRSRPARLTTCAAGAGSAARAVPPYCCALKDT